MRLLSRNHRISLFSRALPFLDQYIKPVHNRFQHWVQPRLIRIERQLSRRQRIGCITVFCLVMGAYSTTLLVTALTTVAPRSPNYLTPVSISRPKMLPRYDTVKHRHQGPPSSNNFSYPSPPNK